jgi:gliding motility-associated-like protein
MRITTLFIFSILVSFLGWSQSKKSDAWFHPNKGQWKSEILYKVELGQGAMYVEKDGFTYFLHNHSDLHDHHHGHAHGEEGHSPIHDDELKIHGVFTKFKNSSWKGEVIESDTSSFYRNYFIGSDSSKWAHEVYSFQSLRLLDYYPDIDLVIDANATGIKYSFDAAPHANIDLIEVEHQGADSVYLKDDNVYIATRFGAIKESDLNVFSLSESGNQSKIKSKFKIENKTVRFSLLEEYNKEQRLIIDPQLTFSTFTGSTSDNWGFTAAPDINANTFGGGIVMGTGYPTSAGAYSQTYSGGEGQLSFDIGISKFNQQGNTLLYSTYIGGGRNETPNSIVSDANGNLYVLGVTSSIDFPVTTGAPQTTFSGGALTVQNGLQFTGTDLIVFKLNPTGTNLIGSSFYGGSGNDGLNLQTLNYNYGDQFRGEIILDDANNVYIASTTLSNNFPVVNGFDGTLSGGQDAVVAKFSENINAVLWSTYLGGAGSDCGNSVQIGQNGNVYVAGGTTSNSLGFSSGNNLSNSGGLADGYVVQLNATSSNPINGTFIGTSGYDQAYFVQIDLAGDVYVFGQTDGNMQISPGVYSNPNSGQFIRKYDGALANIEWTTRIGGGSGNIEISPTAFLVSDCDEIYFAGWGGQTNQTSQASQSSTNNFATTNDAFQGNTNGNNFYVAVLGDNASTLNYASYMGGITSSANHVDGGTSRFDKKGRIYHAVCASCGATNTGFTSTPGVYSETSPSPNCNMAVFKFDLGIIESTVSTPAPFICIPDPVEFENNSQNANEFFWDFGDGNTSTDFEPSHNYTQPGTYTVVLVASDTNGCYEADSSIIEITIGLFEGAVTDPGNAICIGESIQLEASGGSTYAWSPANVLDDSTSATPTATLFETTTFTVIIDDTCGSDTLEVTVEVIGGEAEIIDDFSMCLGDTAEIWADGGVSYEWSPASEIIGNSTDPVVEVSPEYDATFSVEIITVDGCTVNQSVDIVVFDDVPQPVIDDTAKVCLGDEITVTVSGGETYEWFPDLNINTTVGPTATINTTESTWYYVEFTNPCGTELDSIFIEVVEVFPTAGNDTIICPGETATIWADGGVSYSWSPAATVSSPNSATTEVTPVNSTTYTATVTDENGCFATADVQVDLFPSPYVFTSPDVYPFQGDEIELTANGSGPGTYSWAPEDNLSCTDCQTTSLIANENAEYFVYFVDENGCEAMDDVRIILEGIIYVPNSFTPDGDGHNDTFYPQGGNIVDFQMIIFNRWGEVVFESFNLNGQWDGTYGGKVCKDGTYVWKITYRDVSNNKKELVGHVNLLK